MDGLRIERRDEVVIAHLDDGKANALSFDLIDAISSALDEAEVDSSVGAFVLHGREGRFSAGFDLGVMRGNDFEAIVELVSRGGDLVSRLYGSTIPVVAACTGHALAAGALLLLGCDVRVGADIDCKIGLNEVAIGMVLPGWALTIASVRLSPLHSQRAVVNAKVTDGRGAVDAGFLDEVVPADDVLDAAVNRARELAQLDRLAYAGTVRAFRGATLARMAEQLASDRAAGRSPLS
jgi:enoyl-CoA hydratase